MSVRTRIEWNGDKIAAEARESAAIALFEGAEVLLEEANRLVPHDEGTLERSGESSVEDRELIAAVSYDTPYAVRLHEHPEYHFQGNRQGKWLETAVQQQGGRIRDHIAAVIRRALGG